MRIMQVVFPHAEYLVQLYNRTKKLKSFAALNKAFLDDFYWSGHVLTPALERMGHETFLCVAQDYHAQQCWCAENNAAWNAQQPEKALREQVARFEPDVLYFGCAAMYRDHLLQLLPYRPKIVAGWHATLTRSFMSFSEYDLILSSHRECLAAARSAGAKATAYAYPGADAEAAALFRAQKQTDICFSGYWGEAHPRRNAVLADLALRLPERNVNCGYYLSFFDNGPECPPQVQRINRGPVWGRSMLRAFAASKIVLNGHASISGEHQSLSPNLRQLEAMSVGSFLLSEASDNLAAFFTEGKDLVTYASAEDLFEKALYYLQHEDEREAVAAHGAAAVLREYNMDVRAEAFMDTVLRTLRAGEDVAVASLISELDALLAACARDAAALQGAEGTALVVRALESACNARQRQDTAHGHTLWDRLAQLPPISLKNMDFCRALHSLHRHDPTQAEVFLRRELAAFPANDPARQCLSDLVLQGRTGRAGRSRSGGAH